MSLWAISGGKGLAIWLSLRFWGLMVWVRGLTRLTCSSYPRFVFAVVFADLCANAWMRCDRFVPSRTMLIRPHPVYLDLDYFPHIITHLFSCVLSLLSSSRDSSCLLSFPRSHPRLHLLVNLLLTALPSPRSQTQGSQTIEGDPFAALVKAGAVSSDNADDHRKVDVQRAARTDAGVHAAGNWQVLSSTSSPSSFPNHSPT